MKDRLNPISIICLALLIVSFFLGGCATVPPVATTLPTYTIGGIKYIPLIPLCEQKDLIWSYDTITQVISMEKGSQKIVFRVGDNVVIVNGNERRLNYPVDIYRGAVVLPYRFKEEIIDAFFTEEITVPKITAVPCSKIKKIVIDPGHGGHDPGAIGKSGLREKDVVLDISRRLARCLEAAGREVILTRSTDVFVSLSRRADIANRKDVDLFVSIHANANPSHSLSGFEVYGLPLSLDDEERALQFAKNNHSRSQDTLFYKNSPELKAIVWDMVYTSNRQESMELTKHICRSVSADSGARNNGVKTGAFYVLKWTQMPAVLIEVGYISNAEEEKLLKSNTYRQQIAEQIANGILSYCQTLTLTRADQ